jgi:hypothetical protein
MMTLNLCFQKYESKNYEQFLMNYLEKLNLTLIISRNNCPSIKIMMQLLSNKVESGILAYVIYQHKIFRSTMKIKEVIKNYFISTYF